MPFIKTDNRLILFIHIPKTGGTSVEEWMKGFGPLAFHTPVRKPPSLNCTAQHLRFWDYRQLFPPRFFDYAFAIVRNPFRRLESEYRYRWKMKQEGIDTAMPQFPIWLDAQLDAYAKDPFHLDNHMRPQWQFASKNMTVFRFEDGLDQILAQVARDTGLPAPDKAPRKMVSDTPKATLEFDWDISDIERVLQVYKGDFDRFNYPTDPTL